MGRRNDQNGAGNAARLTADLGHRSRGRREARRVDAVARGFGPYDLTAEGLEVGVGGAGAEQVPHGPLPGGEEAVAEGAVGGEAEAVAGAAEGVGDAGDDPDLARAVGEAVAVGRCRVVVARANWLEREDGVDTLDDLLGGHHVGTLPG